MDAIQAVVAANPDADQAAAVETALAALRAETAIHTARGDQIQAELDELRRQRESGEQEARELAQAWAENRRGPTKVIDLTRLPDETQRPDVLNRSQVPAEARELAQRWSRSMGT